MLKHITKLSFNIAQAKQIILEYEDLVNNKNLRPQI